jgi:hypothetical protein
MSNPNPFDDAPLRFSARLFAAVAHFRALKDIRYYLCGIRWEPHPAGGALLMATDGHRLAVAFDAEGRCARAQTTHVSAGLCVAARHSQAKLIAVAGERLTCFDKLHRETFVQPGTREIEGKWPRIDSVLPDPKTLRQSTPSVFNAQYIGDLGTAARLLRAARVDGLSFWQKEGEPTSAMLARYDTEPNFVVLTMPMREREAFQPLTFFDPLREVKAEKGAQRDLAEAGA